jgi:hypothetical protein
MWSAVSSGSSRGAASIHFNNCTSIKAHSAHKRSQDAPTALCHCRRARRVLAGGAKANLQTDRGRHASRDQTWSASAAYSNGRCARLRTSREHAGARSRHIRSLRRHNGSQSIKSLLTGSRFSPLSVASALRLVGRRAPALQPAVPVPRPRRRPHRRGAGAVGVSARPLRDLSREPLSTRRPKG